MILNKILFCCKPLSKYTYRRFFIKPGSGKVGIEVPNSLSDRIRRVVEFFVQ